MNPSNFLRGQSCDPRDTPEGKAILVYKSQLESMRDMFLYQLDFRVVAKRNIDGWEKELRGIVMGIRNLRNTPQIDNLLLSCDGTQAMIFYAIDKLYLASDILQKKNITIKDRQTLYQKLRECQGYLTEAIDEYFLI